MVDVETYLKEALEQALKYYLEGPHTEDEHLDVLSDFNAASAPLEIPVQEHLIRRFHYLDSDSGLPLGLGIADPTLLVDTFTQPKDPSVLELHLPKIGRIFREAGHFSGRQIRRLMLLRDGRDRTGLSLHGGLEIVQAQVTDAANRYHLCHRNVHILTSLLGYHPDFGFRVLDNALHLSQRDYVSDCFGAKVTYGLTREGLRLEFDGRLYEIVGIDREAVRRSNVPNPKMPRPPKSPLPVGWRRAQQPLLVVEGRDSVYRTMWDATFASREEIGITSDAEILDALAKLLQQAPAMTVPELIAKICLPQQGRANPDRVEQLVIEHTLTPNPFLPDVVTTRENKAALESAGSALRAASRTRVRQPLAEALDKDPRILGLMHGEHGESRSRLLFLRCTDAQWDRLAFEAGGSNRLDQEGIGPEVIQLGSGPICLNVDRGSPRAVADALTSSLASGRRIIVFGSSPPRGIPRELSNLGLLERYSRIAAKQLNGEPKAQRRALPIEPPAPRKPLVTVLDQEELEMPAPVTPPQPKSGEAEHRVGQVPALEVEAATEGAKVASPAPMIHTPVGEQAGTEQKVDSQPKEAEHNQDSGGNLERKSEPDPLGLVPANNKHGADLDTGGDHDTESQERTPAGAHSADDHDRCEEPARQPDIEIPARTPAGQLLLEINLENLGTREPDLAGQSGDENQNKTSVAGRNQPSTGTDTGPADHPIQQTEFLLIEREGGSVLDLEPITTESPSGPAPSELADASSPPDPVSQPVLTEIRADDMAAGAQLALQGIARFDLSAESARQTQATDRRRERRASPPEPGKTPQPKASVREGSPPSASQPPPSEQLTLSLDLEASRTTAETPADSLKVNPVEADLAVVGGPQSNEQSSDDGESQTVTPQPVESARVDPPEADAIEDDRPESAKEEREQESPDSRGGPRDVTEQSIPIPVAVDRTGSGSVVHPIQHGANTDEPNAPSDEPASDGALKPDDEVEFRPQHGTLAQVPGADDAAPPVDLGAKSENGLPPPISEIFTTTVSISQATALKASLDFIQERSQVATEHDLVVSIGVPDGVRVRAAFGLVEPREAASAIEIAAGLLTTPQGKRIGRRLSTNEPIKPGQCGYGIDEDGDLFMEVWLPGNWFPGGGIPSETATRVFDAFVSSVSELQSHPELGCARDRGGRSPDFASGTSTSLPVQQAPQSDQKDPLETTDAFDRAKKFVDAHHGLAAEHGVILSMPNGPGVTARATFGAVAPHFTAAALELAATCLTTDEGKRLGRAVTGDTPVCPGELGYGIDDEGRLYFSFWISDQWLSEDPVSQKAVGILHGFIGYALEFADNPAAAALYVPEAGATPPSKMSMDI